MRCQFFGAGAAGAAAGAAAFGAAAAGATTLGAAGAGAAGAAAFLAAGGDGFFWQWALRFWPALVVTSFTHMHSVLPRHVASGSTPAPVSPSTSQPSGPSQIAGTTECRSSSGNDGATGPGASCPVVGVESVDRMGPLRRGQRVESLPTYSPLRRTRPILKSCACSPIVRHRSRCRAASAVRLRWSLSRRSQKDCL